MGGCCCVMQQQQQQQRPPPPPPPPPPSSPQQCNNDNSEEVPWTVIGKKGGNLVVSHYECSAHAFSDSQERRKLGKIMIANNFIDNSLQQTAVEGGLDTIYDAGWKYRSDIN